MRLYPVGSAAWRRVLIPVAGSLGMGYLLFRYFPDARGSGVPQTKAALFARDGVITLAHRRRKVLLHFRHACQWDPPGTRGTFRPSRRWHRFGAGAPPGIAAGEREGAHSGRSSRRDCSRV